MPNSQIEIDVDKNSKELYDKITKNKDKFSKQDYETFTNVLDTIKDKVTTEENPIETKTNLGGLKIDSENLVLSFPPGSTALLAVCLLAAGWFDGSFISRPDGGGGLEYIKFEIWEKLDLGILGHRENNFWVISKEKIDKLLDFQTCDTFLLC